MGQARRFATAFSGALRRWFAIGEYRPTQRLVVSNHCIARRHDGWADLFNFTGQSWLFAAAREPLLIRGYFSAKTHPLLAPLVPQMQDLLREYEIAGNGAVRVEIVDPVQDPEQESEANSKYGIRAVPFQVADRYQASVVNYFDVLVEYGDEYEVLSFADLIEVKAGTETELDVRLKNPEFDVTRSIKRVALWFSERRFYIRQH